jgi:hypothetical protein
MVLRAFPLVCAIGSLVLFFAVVERLLEGPARPVAMALAAACAPLLVYGLQVKQYSSDVAVALILLLLGLELLQWGLTPRRTAWAIAAGVVLVWFSQPAVFVLAGLSCVLVAQAWPRRERAGDGQGGSSRKLGIVLACSWVGSALVATAVGWASVTPEQRAYLHTFWADGFVPMPPWRAEAVRWPIRTLHVLFGRGGQASLEYPLPFLYVGLAGLGFWSLWRRQRAAAAMLLATPGVTLVAAIAHQYPFSDRLVLFLLPTFLIAVAEGIDWIRRQASRRARWLEAAALVLAVPPLVPVLASPPPYTTEDLKPVLEYVRAHRLPDDRLYVYYGALASFRYYGSRYGFGAADYVPGTCHRGHTRAYFEELDGLRGSQRLWVIISHSIALYDERGDILRYLDAVGTRQAEIVTPFHAPVGTRQELLGSSEAYLYEIDDSARAGAVSAASFPLPRSIPLDPRFGCTRAAGVP